MLFEVREVIVCHVFANAVTLGIRGCLESFLTLLDFLED